ncbi:MAG TPA: 23S rRNA (adenine(2030)-N(6))-methyltransferase RlmJ [Rhodanobacteraceae bacterium]|nr:23S rRNA (adenine(2030)-N(6))-methyltransferase RlmJ [Rhodanobacteraceae bacterium]
MINYRHAFHAGNFADVFKHTVLVGLIEALKVKPTAFCYVETHAGRGRYDLRGKEAARSPEYVDGVQRVLDAADAPGGALRQYADLVRSSNPERADGLVVYPGSPLLASRLMRERDRALLCELQKAEADALRTLFRGDPRIAVFQRDGYAALGALLPPTPRRGLVLIDPPFEAQGDEFRTIERALGIALDRWPTGVYAIWYPIKLRRAVTPFHRWLAGRNNVPDVLVAELLLHPENSPLRLNGAGMAIINPPWRFDRTLRELLPVLLAVLSPARPARQRVRWLETRGRR